MSEPLTKVVVDCSTGEQEIVALTAEEIAQREIAAAAIAEAQAEREALEAQKASDKADAIETLVGLGLTEAQISALIG